MQERRVLRVNGIAMVALFVILAFATLALFGAGVADLDSSNDVHPLPIILSVILGIASMSILTGFTIIAPNEARVVVLFGRYLGSIVDNGFWWTVPFTKREFITLRIRNFDSQKLKVNDAVGNPVEIGAVIVWRVKNTAQAMFDVDDFEAFVKIQTETAIRHVANEYPYDNYQEGEKTLRGNADDVTAALQAELQIHLEQAGVEVLDTRLTHLAYAQEIAADMLRRQQASAVVAARYQIVEGAVGMVQEALQMLSDKGIVSLDEERKAAMVSNLLVVLCSEHHVQPVLNSGSLYT